MSLTIWNFICKGSILSYALHYIGFLLSKLTSEITYLLKYVTIYYAIVNVQHQLNSTSNHFSFARTISVNLHSHSLLSLNDAI